MAVKNELSPMMKQYKAIKEQNPDSLLFFRLGDFYEMFFEDAETASKELGLTLTGRDCGLEERAPMCGVPFHSCETYIAKLVKKGYKVAICEQTEDPAKAKGLVSREIIRIITPGTVTDGNMLDSDTNNFICSVYKNKNIFALAFADSSTGELSHIVYEGKNALYQAENEIYKYSPAEILLNKDAFDSELTGYIKAKLSCVFEVIDNHYYDDDISFSAVVRQFGEDVTKGNFTKGSEGVKCVGGLLDYLKNMRLNDLRSIRNINFYDNVEYMHLDAAAHRNLELFSTLRSGENKGSLFWVLDRTCTPMGKRLLRLWLSRPLTSVAPILRRQGAVGELYNNSYLSAELSDKMERVYDVERLMTRALYGSANAPDLLSLSVSLSHIAQVKALLGDVKSPLLREIFDDLDEMTDIRSLIDASINDDNPPTHLRDGGIIKVGYNSELDILRDDMNGGHGLILAIEQKEKEQTGIKNLKVKYNKVFGYYIEVTNSYKDLVPEHYIRKQTTTNSERYITEELKNLESRVLGAKDRSVQMEYEIFCAIREEVAKNHSRIAKSAEAIAKLDVLCAFGEVARRNGYICPEIATDGEIRVKSGRHPVVETVLSNPFVPNDILLNQKEYRCAVITGPNMAGKSTYMRMTALISIMAQMGCFVPAEEAKVSIVDGVYTRVGASDDLYSGQSTFMVEMSEVTTILKNATKNSLLILDEIGRGTSTYDGVSIAGAVLEYIASEKLGAKTLFATHYHELTEMEGRIKGVNNYHIAVKKRGDDITFLRRICKGVAEGSYGIEVAALAGVPSVVVQRAKEILAQLTLDAPVQNTPKMVAPAHNTNMGQMSLLNDASPVIERLKKIDINTLTPIEALMELGELAKMVD